MVLQPKTFFDYICKHEILAMNILITGTSSGIGEGLTNYYLSTGNKVWGISRRENKTLKSFSEYRFLRADLSKEEEIIEVLANLKSKNITLDLVILNAGILGEIKPMYNQKMETVFAIMQINVWANKILIDNLIKNNFSIRQIVAISSGAAKNGSAGWGPYSISKAALNMLIKTYASEFSNIHFSAIAPGLVDTAMQEYISNLDNELQFPAVERLKKVRGTSEMPDAFTIAPILANLFKKVLTMDSGIYTDIRDL